MIVKLREAIRIANKKYAEKNRQKAISKRRVLVSPDDLAVMLQYAILGLNATDIEVKMNKKFTRETIRKHIQPYKLSQRTVDELKVFEYLKNFDTSYAAGIEA